MNNVLTFFILTISFLPIINSSGFLHLKLTSSTRVNLKLKFLNDYQKSLFKESNAIDLFPNHTLSGNISFHENVRLLQYTAIVTNSTTEKVFMHTTRRVELENEMDLIEDVISNGEVVVKIELIYQCNNGWFGSMCDKKCNCQNEGKCKIDNVSNETFCVCQFGFVGDLCQFKMSPMVSSPSSTPSKYLALLVLTIPMILFALIPIATCLYFKFKPRHQLPPFAHFQLPIHQQNNEKTQKNMDSNQLFEMLYDRYTSEPINNQSNKIIWKPKAPGIMIPSTPN